MATRVKLKVFECTTETVDSTPANNIQHCYQVLKHFDERPKPYGKPLNGRTFCARPLPRVWM